MAAGVTVGPLNDRLRLVFPEGCAQGLQELAAVSRANTAHLAQGPMQDKACLYFSRCVFEPGENWIALAFDRLLGADGRLLWLCGELEKRAYRRIDCFDGKKISLDYVKQHGKKEEPLKIAWAERTHYGISLTYEELRLEPCFLWIRMPMFKYVLESIQKLPGKTVEFIIGHTKTCDGCRYCVQADKTGTRPLAHVDLNGKKKCPYYPGFTMNWRELSPELAQSILDLLDAIHQLPQLA